ncbi:phage major capsid protein, P2 family [Lentisphaerota bacterium WC36G]|nr:phage major capsid protein, P2 family [Lentisphaerae bacterium WC36]
MRRDTVKKFCALQTAMAAAYGVGDVRSFEAEAPEAIKLMTEIQKSAEFLNDITVLPVTDIVGRPITMSLTSTVASRTNTDDGTKERSPQNILDLNDIEYRCYQTDFDVAIKYKDMDAMARFPNFQQLYMQMVYVRIALDRILIGWYGKTVADNSDRSANPKLEDLNKGWPALLKEHNPSHYIEQGATAGKIRICAGGDYENLDEAVYDIASVIPQEHRTGNEIAIIGQGLITQDTGKILKLHGQTPTERSLFKTLEKSYGGFECRTSACFPEHGIFVGDLKHLHLYFQESGVRRQSCDNPKKNQVEDFISSNDAYMIEDFNSIAMINHENVVFE